MSHNMLFVRCEENLEDPPILFKEAMMTSERRAYVIAARNPAAWVSNHSVDVPTQITISRIAAGIA